MLSKALLGLSALCSVAGVQAAPVPAAPYEYVLAFSVDGMHSIDVDNYVTARPKSNVAKLLSTGYEYTNAFTSAVCLVFLTPRQTPLTGLLAAFGLISRLNGAIHRR